MLVRVYEHETICYKRSSAKDVMRLDLIFKNKFYFRFGRRLDSFHWLTKDLTSFGYRKLDYGLRRSILPFRLMLQPQMWLGNTVELPARRDWFLVTSNTTPINLDGRLAHT